jgi:FixJ family two-component response regulator
MYKISFKTAMKCAPVSCEKGAGGGRPLVSVVDDDESVRESLPDLLYELGFDARTFVSGAEFLASESISKTRCLLLDLSMPGMSGEELQAKLQIMKKAIPIVFITANDDEAVRTRVIRNGASGCLFKPFADDELFDAINDALAKGN